MSAPSSEKQPTDQPTTRKRGPGRPFAKGKSGNPGGRARARADADRDDGAWASEWTGHGVEGVDKRLAARFKARPVTWETATNLWRGNWLAAKIIEKLPREATRAGFELDLPEDQDAGTSSASSASSARARAGADRLDGEDAADLKKRVHDFWKALAIVAELRTVDEYRRAYGGGALLLGADDRRPLERPLDVGSVRAFDWVTPLEARELQPLYYYTDLKSPKYGKPSHYQVTPTTQGTAAPRELGGAEQTWGYLNVVHESRLIILEGHRVSRNAVSSEGDWGDSVLMRVEDTIRDYDVGWDTAGSLLLDFAQGVYSIKDLAELISRDGGRKFRERIAAMERMRSALRAIVIGEGETYDRKTTPLGGLAEVLREMRDRVSAAADMPATVLFGVSPGGLNATGESDLTIWDKSVGTHAADTYVCNLERVTAIAFAMWGVQPEGWSVKPCPRHTRTPKEQAEERQIVATTDAIYLDRGVVDKETVARSRWGGPTYSPEMMVDFDEREAVLEAGAAPEDIRDPAAAHVEAGAEGQPAVAPGAPVTAATGDPTDIQATVMNGAQVNAMLEVLARVGRKEIPIAAAEQVFQAAFQMAPERARELLAPMASFEAPPPAPSGPGRPPFSGPPGAPPPRADYDPDQARDEGGRWTAGGAGATAGNSRGAPVRAGGSGRGASRSGTSNARGAAGSKGKVGSRASSAARASAKAHLDAIKANASKPIATTPHARVRVDKVRDADRATTESKVKEYLGRDVTLDEVSRGFAPPPGFTAEVAKFKMNGDRAQVEIHVFDDSKPGGKPAVRIQNDFLPDGTVKHAFIGVASEYQSQGLGDAINARAFAHYEKWGVQKVELDADWVGRYAWPRSGYSFKDPEAIAKSFERFVEARVSDPDRRADLVAKASELVKEPWNLAKWDNGEKFDVEYKASSNPFSPSQRGNFPLGKAFLLSDDVPRFKMEMKIDEDNPGYLHALEKMDVASRRVDAIERKPREGGETEDLDLDVLEEDGFVDFEFDEDGKLVPVGGRADYDPDQPREQNGQWGEGGFSGGGGESSSGSSGGGERVRTGAMNSIANALGTAAGKWVEGGPGDEWHAEVARDNPARGKAVRAAIEAHGAIEDGDVEGAKEKLKAAIAHFEEDDPEIAHMLKVDIEFADQVAEAHADQRVAEGNVSRIESEIDEASGDVDEAKEEAGTAAGVARMEKDATKLETKIEKMKAKGEDTTDEEAELDDHRAEIIVAQERQAALPAKLAEIKARVAELKAQKKEAAKKVRAAENKMSKLAEKIEAKKGGYEPDEPVDGDGDGDVEEEDDPDEDEGEE